MFVENVKQTQIALTQNEIAIVRGVQRKREENAQTNGFNWIAKTRDREINLVETLAAEFAFCKLFNCWPPLGWNDYERADCTYKTFKIDVKLVPPDRENVAIMRIGQKATNPPDLAYAAMRRADPQKALFEYLGYIQECEVEKVGTVRQNENNQSGKYALVPIASLRKSFSQAILF